MSSRRSAVVISTLAASALALLGTAVAAAAPSPASSAQPSPVSSAQPSPVTYPIVAGVNDALAVQVRAALGLSTDASVLGQLTSSHDLVALPNGVYLTPVESAEIQRRNVVAASLPTLTDALEAQYSQYFAGIGIDQEAAGEVVVVLLPGYPAAVPQLITNTLPVGTNYAITAGHYSLVKIQDVENDIIGANAASIAAKGGLVQRVAIDELANEVTVTTTAQSYSTTDAILNSLYGTAVKVTVDNTVPVAVDRNTPQVHMIDGDNIETPGGGCTGGFSAITPDGHYWLITAGHCQGTNWYVGPTTNNYFIGPKHKSLFMGTTDCDCETIGPITTTQTWNRPNNVIYNAPNVYWNITQYAASGSALTQGQTLYFSGAKGGGSGHVVMVTVSQENAHGTYDGVTVNDLVQVTTVGGSAVSGDSGAPVYNQLGGSLVRIDGVVAAALGSSGMLFSPTWVILDPTIGLNSTPLTYQP